MTNTVTIDGVTLTRQQVEAAYEQLTASDPMTSGTVIVLRNGEYGYLMLDAAELLREAERAQQEGHPFVGVSLHSFLRPQISGPERQRDLATDESYERGTLQLVRGGDGRVIGPEGR